MLNTEFILLRFFEEDQHVEEFRSGQIRMMSAKHYKEIEKYSTKLYDNRYDSLENAAFIHNSNSDGTINFTEPIKIGDHEYTKMWVDPNSVHSPVRIANDYLDEITKILSLYCIPKHDIVDGMLSSCISTLVNDFGNFYCLITNTSEFISRIINGVLRSRKQKIIGNGQYGFARYVDENDFNGRYGPFCKPSGLSWQSEFRIIIETIRADPFYLLSDCLKDITIWGNVSDLFDGRVNENGDLIVSNFRR